MLADIDAGASTLLLLLLVTRRRSRKRRIVDEADALRLFQRCVDDGDAARLLLQWRTRDDVDALAVREAAIGGVEAVFATATTSRRGGGVVRGTTMAFVELRFLHVV